MKKIFIYTEHSKESLFERKISKEFVENTIINPDKIFESIKGRKIAQKEFNNKLLRVIYKETDKIYIVITVYYSKLERY
ncbi:hypothetical protein COU53_00170 [Candidatus Pacearchaeota archaeon CG10_big_fil_rev_8_21_14_0_10_30_48]|nr:MAG: hypothetical protein COU53_00170 [Candidatus Pacearchaeota archaeon CG10_big_fil_rev_8_21_14_0_10_30_48]